ncbi:MAG TPA: TIGR02186 family protein [Aliidongia sp.]|uniref:TIGR02186 family protein n=1 Tax=Aliidongia sp. TaxID=1914230 RepID=UPI002DDD2C67|nr:TIGR02186 family protein [Aliidongia sp.]HEV2673988.1 TIGR02186 family protein [Aliidongia sp.]
MTRRVLPALFAALLLAALPTAARAQQLVADLTSHLVAITTGFTGASVVLFGAVDGGGDIVVVVRGPEHETVVRRKSRVAGIWLNTRSVAFANVPSYYAVLANKPVEDIVPANLRQLHEIGFDNLKLNPAEKAKPGDVVSFRAALIEEQQRSGLYNKQPGQVNFLGDRLFRASLDFPATVQTGTYLVQVFLVRKGDIVAAQTTPLIISQTGLEADINDFAQNRSLLYGLVAVAMAAMAGWSATFLFRNA